MSGWCSPGPVGSKPPHVWGNKGSDGCPSSTCECWCHDELEELLDELI